MGWAERAKRATEIKWFRGLAFWRKQIPPMKAVPPIPPGIDLYDGSERNVIQQLVGRAGQIQQFLRAVKFGKHVPPAAVQMEILANQDLIMRSLAFVLDENQFNRTGHREVICRPVDPPAEPGRRGNGRNAKSGP